MAVKKNSKVAEAGPGRPRVAAATRASPVGGGRTLSSLPSLQTAGTEVGRRRRRDTGAAKEQGEVPPASHHQRSPPPLPQAHVSKLQS